MYTVSMDAWAKSLRRPFQEVGITTTTTTTTITTSFTARRRRRMTSSGNNPRLPGQIN